MDDLPTVLHKFLNTRDVIDTEAKVEQLTFEACEDMFLLSNVHILELRYALPSCSTPTPPWTLTACSRPFCVARPAQRPPHPMVVGSSACFNASKSVEDNAFWCDWILERKAHFVGMDLADDEVSYPASFAPLFQKAKAQGLGITVHAGEPDVPGAAKNILIALDELGQTASDTGSKSFTTPRSWLGWPKTACLWNCAHGATCLHGLCQI